MPRDADHSQAAASELPQCSQGRVAVIGSALVVFGIVGVLLGYAVGSLEEAEGVSLETAAGPSQAGSFAVREQEVSSRIDSIGLLSAELAALRRDLEEEHRAREVLAERLAWLSAREGIAIPESPPTAPDPFRPQSNDGVSKPATSAEALADHRHAGPRRDRPWFDRDVLGRAGISSSEIEEIERRWEGYEMDKLYLADQSKRDGTFQSAGYNEEVSSLRRELREDLGPEGYDALLYATGSNNRVVVRQVLENSPAGRAGLEAGDVIVRYSGQRVFRPDEFKRATTIGQFGTPVTLEVLRDGVLYRFSVPRGPLGISMRPFNDPPLQDR